jgi:hypothetical protein
MIKSPHSKMLEIIIILNSITSSIIECPKLISQSETMSTAVVKCQRDERNYNITQQGCQHRQREEKKGILHANTGSNNFI